MEDIWESYGARYAQVDYDKYLDGEYTKEDLANECELAGFYAEYGDEEGQCIGYGYLKKMEELGFIKNLRRVD